ncbi:MAG TPA: hypothetical protein VF918_06585, partial [Anaerolineales bacterium]
EKTARSRHIPKQTALRSFQGYSLETGFEKLDFRSVSESHPLDMSISWSFGRIHRISGRTFSLLVVYSIVHSTA